MHLEPGSEVGDYKILGLLGEGAMGTVYRARDRRLAREIALKVLSPELSRDKDRLARFEREARILANLNHPNIAMIHGVGVSGETRFIVLELVEGSTLGDLVSRGRLSTPKAMELALQLATALEAAHTKGIVHRDLKPANIKVTSDDQIKVLDFGIAKYFGSTPQESSADPHATVTDLATDSKTIMGTLGYMSPEQIRGLAIDGRTDIWGFGCVLFELLTGRRAFRGKTPSDTLVQVLEGEPHWRSLPEGAPWAIVRLLRRCLRKDRRHRIQAMGDVRIEIEDILSEDISNQDERFSRPRPWKTTVLAALLSCLLAGLLVDRVFFLPSPARTKTASPERVTRFSVTLPDGQTLPYLEQRSLALAPDGSRLAYVVREQTGWTRIFERRLDRLEAAPVPETPGASEPFFSPDGKWLGFFLVESAARLQRVSFEGGVPVVFHEETLPPRGGVVWAQNGDVVFAGANAIRSISSNGGVARDLACASASMKGDICRWPEVLPGGNAILYTLSAPGGDSAVRIVAESLVTGERRTLVEGASAARYSRTGHLVYSQEGGIFAGPFDVEALRFTRPPSRVAADVLVDRSTGAAQFALSDEGTLAYVAGAATDGLRRLVVIDDSGGISWTSELRAPLRGSFRLAPNGKTLAVALEQRRRVEIGLYDLESHELRRFTTGGRDDDPVWSPDGTRIVFRSAGSGRTNLFVKRIESDGPASPLTDRDDVIAPGSWAGGRIAFTVRSAEGGIDVWALDEATGKSGRLLTAKSNETEPEYSADGSWLAYVSDATGREEVYVTPSEHPGDAMQVSSGGGSTPRWSADGKRLYYRRGRDLLSEEIDLDRRRVLRPPSFVWTAEVDPSFELLRDGGVLTAEPPVAPHQIVVLSPFTTELTAQ